jgi:hypothetical protein
MILDHSEDNSADAYDVRLGFIRVSLAAWRSLPVFHE